VLALFWPQDASVPTAELPSDNVNLALRRTADGLLRASGDSSSRIPAIEQTAAQTWRINLSQAFQYDSLPGLLEASLHLYSIDQTYNVAVRRCFDKNIVLGYHQADVQNPKSETPCMGREMPEGCHYIEVSFIQQAEQLPLWHKKSAFLMLVLGGLAVWLWFNRRKPKPETNEASVTTPDAEWLLFGQSRLDVAGQTLICNGITQTLTFREAKLLRLFAANPNHLLERDTIIQQVWADEGVLVGRSVDMFVSRLRKKLAADPSVGIVAVHGVGYRLETGK
jgi:Transcriptional regulatory protein, C terminal